MEKMRPHFISEKRNDGYEHWIDIFKGTAILLVVIGHLEIPAELYRYIFMFHMYAFFFIGGLTFRKKAQPVSQMLWSNTKRLLIPYIVFAFLWDATNYATQVYLHNAEAFSVIGLLKNIAAVLIGGGSFSSSTAIGPAWFLLSLFTVRVGYDLLCRLKLNRIIRGVICAAIITVGFLCNHLSFLPFKLFSSMTAFFFFYLGDMSKWLRSDKLTQKKSVYILVWGTVFAVSAIAELFLSKWADADLILVSNLLPSNPVIVLLGGMIGCTMLVALAKLLDMIGLVGRIFSYYGKNSLLIMGIHSEIHWLLSLVFEVFCKIDGAKTALPIFVITLIICIPCQILVDRFFPWIVGKKK